MKILSFSGLNIGLLCLLLLASGCGTSKEPAKQQANHHHDEHVDDAEIKSNMAKLSEEDRPLAEAQGYCVTSEEPLGSMGVPLKVVLNEVPVFVCCKGCEKKAKANPEKSLAKAKELQAKVKATPKDPHDEHSSHDSAASEDHDEHQEHSDHGKGVAIPRKLIVGTAPVKPQAGSPTKLVMQIQGNDDTPIKAFSVIHEKLLHLIVVREGLDEFAHLHPIVDESGLITTEFTFPKAGKYRLFADHQPQGQSPGLAVGEVSVAGEFSETEDLTANLPGNISVADVAVRVTLQTVASETVVRFEFMDKNGDATSDLQPYLGAMGHLVVISADGHDYVHAHPLGDGQTSPHGKVEFSTHFPKPGLFKVWGQFQRSEKVFTVAGVLRHVPQVVPGHAHGRMGTGMMSGGRGMGMDMMGGRGVGNMAAMRRDMMGLMSLFEVRDSINRQITDLPNGIETITESENETAAKAIREHVAAMYQRLEKNEPLPMMTRDPLFVEVFNHASKIKLKLENTPKGLKVLETADDPYVVKLLQAHARVVDAFIANGMDEVHREHAVPNREAAVKVAK